MHLSGTSLVVTAAVVVLVALTDGAKNCNFKRCDQRKSTVLDNYPLDKYCAELRHLFYCEFNETRACGHGSDHKHAMQSLYLVMCRKESRGSFEKDYNKHMKCIAKADMMPCETHKKAYEDSKAENKEHEIMPEKGQHKKKEQYFKKMCCHYEDLKKCYLKQVQTVCGSEAVSFFTLLLNESEFDCANYDFELSNHGLCQTKGQPKAGQKSSGSILMPVASFCTIPLIATAYYIYGPLYLVGTVKQII